MYNGALLNQHCAEVAWTFLFPLNESLGVAGAALALLRTSEGGPLASRPHETRERSRVQLLHSAASSGPKYSHLWGQKCGSSCFTRFFSCLQRVVLTIVLVFNANWTQHRRSADEKEPPRGPDQATGSQKQRTLERRRDPIGQTFPERDFQRSCLTRHVQ